MDFFKEEQENNDMKKQKQIINKLLKKPENKYCADCKNAPPTWASINLGVLICMNCSGCHRELGAHISKIKSINLDLWPLDVLENFKKIDNKIANDYWEYNLNLKEIDLNKIKKNRDEIMKFIRNKYEFKKWINVNDIDPMQKIKQNININNNNINNNNEKYQFNWNYFNTNKNNTNNNNNNGNNKKYK